MLITKRDGSVEQFDRNKIKKSILACFEAVDEQSISEVEELVTAVSECWALEDEITVSNVQACTERVLIDYGYKDAAAAFMEYRIERDLLRAERRRPDPSALPDYIHQAKYARWNEQEGRRENYSETVDRVIEMHYEKFPDALHQDITDAFRYVYSRQVLPSMRSMQFAGVAIRKNHARMYNCCFTHVDRDRVFPEVLFLLLSGCGVGYSVQWQHIDRLPQVEPVSRTVYHHTIDDSIEGWADALHELVTSYMGPASGDYVEFDYSKIRAEGLPLITSGGRAPGHLGLKAMLEEVRGVLDGAVGRKLRPIECHDMMCYIARSVLSGGIRRSSMISLFSKDDTEMMYCKARGVFDPTSGLQGQRMMSNNSVVMLRGTEDRAVFNRIMELSASGFGEPGFVFVDCLDDGINPCGEIKLNPRSVGFNDAGFAFCNLSEVNASNCPNASDFVRRCKAAAIIGTLQACYTDFPYLSPASQVIACRDRLIGVSITGIMDNPKCLDWLEQGRTAVQEANTRVAALLNISPSERCCCIKPSGTASLLLGTSAGIHCHHARRYLRRVIVNKIESVGKALATCNPHMVEQKPNGDYCLVFPVQARDDAVIGLTGVVMLEQVMELLIGWCDGHNVSCTVPVGAEALPQLIDHVWNNRHRLAALSFAPLDISKRYPYPPLQAVDSPVLEAYWELLIKEYKSVDYSDTLNDVNVMNVAACEGKRCVGL